MGHNSVVSSHPKSIRIPWVDGLLTRPLDWGCHKNFGPFYNLLLLGYFFWTGLTSICCASRLSI